MTPSARALEAELSREDQQHEETLLRAQRNPIAWAAYLALDMAGNEALMRGDKSLALELWDRAASVLAIARRRDLTSDEQDIVRGILAAAGEGKP